MNDKQNNSSILNELCPYSIDYDFVYFCFMQAPKLPSFFKTARHRQFDFKSRYYDARKEDLEKRVKSAENGNSNLDFSKNWQQSKRSKKINYSNKRIILIVFILLLFSFAILKF